MAFELGISERELRLWLAVEVGGKQSLSNGRQCEALRLERRVM